MRVEKTLVNSSELLVALAVLIFACPAWADQAGKSPVKVFILAGQSNMEGHGMVSIPASTKNQGKGTLEYLVKDPKTAKQYKHTIDENGDWAVRDDVWVTYFENKGNHTVGFGGGRDKGLIGPEYQFGHVMGDYFDNQVLIIKAAWGGKTLAGDFRPPSRGGQPGPYYKEMLEHVREVLANLKKYFPDYDGRGYEIAGFGWHQGWNDGCSMQLTEEYEANLVAFIRDLRKEFNSPKMPFVVANSGFGGWEQKIDRRLKIIESQAAPAKYDDMKDTFRCVETRGCFRPREVSPSGQGYHWFHNAETHFLIGDGMGKAMVELLEK